MFAVFHGANALVSQWALARGGVGEVAIWETSDETEQVGPAVETWRYRSRIS